MIDTLDTFLMTEMKSVFASPLTIKHYIITGSRFQQPIFLYVYLTIKTLQKYKQEGTAASSVDSAVAHISLIHRMLSNVYPPFP